MSTELASVHPTRLELIRLKHRKSMAEGIIDILKKELDTLTLTLFELVKKISPERELMYTTLKQAYTFFIDAEMVSGSKKIKEASLITHSLDYEISEEKKNAVVRSVSGLFPCSRICLPDSQASSGLQVYCPLEKSR